MSVSHSPGTAHGHELSFLRKYIFSEDHKIIGIQFLFSAIIFLFIGGILALLVYETWALLTGHEPITNIVRSSVKTFPGWAFAIAIVVGLAVGHFLWGSADGETDPASRRG